MDRPKNIHLPFFAYGLFRPGQLAFFQLKELVSNILDQQRVSGSLLMRDGLPIIDPEGHGSVLGALLTFRTEQAEKAYDRISAMEPDRHYRWSETHVADTQANLLIGQSPRKGSVPYEDEEWNGWNDPLFTAALDVIEETLNSQDFDWDLKPLFRLQMAYLLLWSAIERYVSLRYSFANNVMDKVAQIAHEPAFATSLPQHVKERREVYRADRPGEKEVLDPKLPRKAVAYYYQVRSNITHRGKGVVWDYERVKNSLTELLRIFRDLLKAAQEEATYSD